VVLKWFYSPSRRKTFVGGKCALPSALFLSGFTGRGNTAAECYCSANDDDNQDDAVTDDDVHGSKDVDSPITPTVRRVQLLFEVGKPNTEHPTVAAHEPRQQKHAQ